MSTATLVKDKPSGIIGAVQQSLYRLDPPMQTPEGGTTEYVWVSAIDAMFTGAETYIFACDEDGEVTDWLELPGSYRGGYDHAEALRGAGYEVA